jgi:hypothetical protein
LGGVSEGLEAGEGGSRYPVRYMTYLAVAMWAAVRKGRSLWSNME